MANADNGKPGDRPLPDGSANYNSDGTLRDLDAENPSQADKMHLDYGEMQDKQPDEAAAEMPAQGDPGDEDHGRGGSDTGGSDSPGHSGDAPGHTGGPNPGHGGTPPGQVGGGSAPGNSGNAPGHAGGSPGKSGEAPGHGGDSHGQGHKA